MKIITAAIISIFSVITINASATTWADTEVDDPILDGEKCQVGEPMSSGSYIYQWESKFDQVFWPVTTPRGIWYCETSGFIALIGDFKRLTAEEKIIISKYLKNNQPDLNNYKDRLRHLEAIYSLRTSEGYFNNRLLRILAYQYETLGDLKLANDYRKRALSQIEARLNLTKEATTSIRLEYLFLASIYNKQLGDEDKYSLYLNQLNERLRTNNDKELVGYIEYLKSLIEEAILIENGGQLAPKSKDK